MPTKAVDAFGLAAGGVNLQSEPLEVTVSKCRLSVIDSISKLIDVDAHLSSDEAFEEALASSANLMKSARYDVDSYIAWAKSEHLKVKKLLDDRAVAKNI
jgi:hypothetical protein